MLVLHLHSKGLSKMQEQTSPKNTLPVIIIGAGSVGVRFVQELFHNNPLINIKIFSGEDKKPYSRENLSELLSGKISEQDLHSESKLPESKHIESFINNPIVNIDHENNKVVDADGIEHPYSSLVLAVGSIPLTPKVEGLDLKNVIVFRKLEDAEALLCRQVASRNTVVIGGGQIGLDAANAMKRHNTRVTVIEHRKRLMFNQLDYHASIYLRLYLDNQGIDVRVETVVDRIEGNNQVESLVLDDGERIDCDTVIIAIGIKPNIKMAKSSGIKVSRGILVDDSLETNLPNVFAIGECIEHRGEVYGQVQPGYDQAKILAIKLAGRKQQQYTGSTRKLSFKVIDYPFLTIGESSDPVDESKDLMYRDIKNMTYRKLILKNGSLHGVIAAGSWENDKSLLKAVENKQRIWPWQRKQFEETGELA